MSAKKSNTIFGDVTTGVKCSSFANGKLWEVELSDAANAYLDDDSGVVYADKHGNLVGANIEFDDDYFNLALTDDLAWYYAQAIDGSSLTSDDTSSASDLLTKNVTKCADPADAGWEDSRRRRR